MALFKNKVSDIPSDAVILNEEDALKYQVALVKTWKHKSDVWPLNHSHTILGTLAGLTAMFVNNHYRTKFRLFDYGRMSSYLPVVIIPTLVTGIYHQQFIVTDVLIQKSCSVCVQVRAASFQTFLSTIFPTILAPLAAMPFAIRYNTYKIPPITEDPKKVFALLYKFTKPIGSILLGIIAAQGLIASFLTYKEMQSVHKIHTSLNELEERLIEEYGHL